MKNLTNLLDNSLIHSKKIREVTSTLEKHFGIDIFSYFKTNIDGKFIVLSLSTDRLNYFFNNKLYLFANYLYDRREWKQSDYFLDGEPQFSRVLQNVPIETSWFSPYLMKQVNSQGELEGFIMACSEQKKILPNMFIKNRPLLKRFCRHFLGETDEVIRRVEYDAVDIYGLINDDKEVKRELAIDPRTINFLSDIGIDRRLLLSCDTLSVREAEVLSYVANGNSAQKIAGHLYLSKRTVEHHIENIKRKLGCYDKHDLIQTAFLLKDLGLLAL